MCNLIWCYVHMLVCVARIIAQLPDQRPSFLAAVRHVSVLSECLPRYPLFNCQRLCEFVSCRDGGCSEGVLFVQLDVFIVLLCRVCGKSRERSPFHVPVESAFWLSHEQPSQSDHSFPGLDECHTRVCLSQLKRPPVGLFKVEATPKRRWRRCHRCID